MLAFVTGATGFLGSHVARALAAQGAELRLLVRPTSDLRNIQGSECRSRVLGDLRDPASIEKALAGATLCFTWRPTTGCGCAIRSEMYRSNVEGTRSLLEAARKQGVRRVVYTSSVATMGFTSKHTRTDRGPWRTREPGVAWRHDRALQAVEIHGRASRVRGGEIWSGCRGGESDDADRRARYQADSDGANRPGFSEAEVSRRMWKRA